MTREEIDQVKHALEESNEGMFILKRFAANNCLFKIEKNAIEQIEENQAALDILSREYDQPPDKLKLPLDVEI